MVLRYFSFFIFILCFLLVSVLPAKTEAFEAFGQTFPDPPIALDGVNYCDYIAWRKHDNTFALLIRSKGGQANCDALTDYNLLYRASSAGNYALTPSTNGGGYNYYEYDGSSWSGSSYNYWNARLPQWHATDCLEDMVYTQTDLHANIAHSWGSTMYCNENGGLGSVTENQLLMSANWGTTPSYTTTFNYDSFSVDSLSGAITATVSGSFDYADVAEEDLCRLDLYDTTENTFNGQPSYYLAHVYVRGEWAGATLGQLPPAYDLLPPVAADVFLATGNVRNFSAQVTLDNTIGTDFDLAYKYQCFYSTYDGETITSYESTGTSDGATPGGTVPTQEQIGSSNYCDDSLDTIGMIICQISTKVKSAFVSVFVPNNQIISTQYYAPFKSLLEQKSPFAYVVAVADMEFIAEEANTTMGIQIPVTLADSGTTMHDFDVLPALSAVNPYAWLKTTFSVVLWGFFIFYSVFVYKRVF